MCLLVCVCVRASWRLLVVLFWCVCNAVVVLLFVGLVVRACVCVCASVRVVI